MIQLNHYWNYCHTFVPSRNPFGDRSFLTEHIGKGHVPRNFPLLGRTQVREPHGRLAFVHNWDYLWWTFIQSIIWSTDIIILLKLITKYCEAYNWTKRSWVPWNLGRICSWLVLFDILIFVLYALPWVMVDCLQNLTTRTPMHMCSYLPIMSHQRPLMNIFHLWGGSGGNVHRYQGSST